MKVLTVTVTAFPTAFAAHLGDKLGLSARMNGAQEVPASGSMATSTATLQLYIDLQVVDCEMLKQGLSEVVSEC